LGVNFEDPNSLILRLKIPTAYSTKEVKECGLQGNKSPEESLASLVRVSAVKGSNAIIELKIRLASKKQSTDCAQAVYQLIRESQFQVLSPYIEDLKILLLKNQTQLQESKDMIPSADKSGSALSAVYLTNREEINFLKTEIFRLNSIINSSDKLSAKLIAPIYASDTPASPDKKRVLQVGLLAGMLSGLVFAFIRKFWFLAK
jgi:capsular polysaccharide biosynthesis protein